MDMRNKIFEKKPDTGKISIWDNILGVIALVMFASFWISLLKFGSFANTITSVWLSVFYTFLFCFIYLIIIFIVAIIYGTIRERFIGKEDKLFNEQRKVIKEDWEEAIKINDAYNYVAEYKQDKETLTDNQKILKKVGIKI